MLEIITIDDGSTDVLSEALAGYGDLVKLIRHERNLGAAAARNSGVAAAKGDYIAFLDSDDVWLPGKVDAQLRAMRSYGWKACCTSYYLARPKLESIVSPRYITGELGLSDLVWGCFVSPGTTLMFERTLFDEVGQLDTDLQRLEDWDWLLRYTQVYALGFLAQPLAKIEASPYLNADRVVAALTRLREKFAPILPAREIRNFRAALDVERAAAYFRTGAFVAASSALIQSLWLAPVGNAALSAVLYNRLARKSLK